MRIVSMPCLTSVRCKRLEACDLQWKDPIFSNAAPYVVAPGPPNRGLPDRQILWRLLQTSLGALIVLQGLPRVPGEHVLYIRQLLGLVKCFGGCAVPSSVAL